MLLICPNTGFPNRSKEDEAGTSTSLRCFGNTRIMSETFRHICLFIYAGVPSFIACVQHSEWFVITNEYLHLFSVSAACHNKCTRRLVPWLKKQIWGESDLLQASEVRIFLRDFIKVLPFSSKSFQIRLMGIYLEQHQMTWQVWDLCYLEIDR